MKCVAIGCFAWWRHFMNHSASVFCFLVQIRAFIILNSSRIFIIINMKGKVKWILVLVTVKRHCCASGQFCEKLKDIQKKYNFVVITDSWLIDWLIAVSAEFC